MRLLVVGPHFPPDTAPTGVVLGRIVAELAELGHEIEVVTSLPWYRDHAVEPGWGRSLIQRASTGWGRIDRLHPFPGDKSDIVGRALAFGGFSVLAGGVAAAAPRADAVLAMSPPLTLGAVGLVAARLHRAPLVFNVQDVFPDVAVEVGAITNGKVIEASRRLERWTYRHADAVTVLSDDLADNVSAKIAGSPGRGGAPKVRVIPNFVDTEAIQPASPDTEYRRELGIRTDATVALYAGNVGFSQSFDALIGAADMLSERSDVVVLVNGTGSARPDLERAAATRPNLVIGDFQPAHRLSEVLATGDIHLVPLKTGLARSSVPSKSYSILAAGRPLVAAVDADSEVARMAESSGGGVWVPPDDAAGLADVILALADDRRRRLAMGESGRRFVERWASPRTVAQRYEALFEELIAARARS